MGCPPFPLKIGPSRGDLDPHLSRNRLYEPNRAHNPNGISIGLVVFAGLMTVAARQTDRPRYSVCNNMMHLADAALRVVKVI